MNRKILLDTKAEKIISTLSQGEVGKRQYYRPVYSLHKWWARRPGVLFRSIILLAAKNLGFTSFDSLFDYKGNDISKKSLFFHTQNLDQMIILDPFMGGGTTLVEGNRLGAKVIGSDINPVSYWIVRETLKPIDLTKLDKYYSKMECTAGKQIKSLYMTKCDRCGNENTNILYAFWVRYVSCLYCGSPVYLFSRYLLNKGMQRSKEIHHKNPATVICPFCHGLTSYSGDGICSCFHCGNRFDPTKKVYHGGKYRCTHCTRESSLIETIKQNSPMRDKLIAIEYFCSICGKRLYKSPDNEDVMLLDNLAHTYKTMKNELVIPRQKIPRGSSSARWIAHDFRFYRQVFSPRQVIAFNHLIRAIDDIPEQEYRNAFITIFSNSLEYNNMMVPYNYPHRKLHHLFTYHALPLTTMPVENNVWGVSNKGAGTFTNCFHRYRKAKEYAKRPYEKFKETKGKIRTVYPYGEKIDAKFVSSFEELKVNNNSALLYCSDSSNLPIPDKSIDAVITDPPYFDNIHYSELSNFFYVWLSLFKLGQWFERDYVPFENEATVNNGMNKTEQNYLECMTSVFTECKRVLKDSGILIFTFHHANPKAWWIILQVLRKSGFFVVDYFPVRSEYKVNPHIRGKAAVDTDLVIICNNHPDSVENSAVNFEKALKRKISDVTGENSVHFYFIGELLKIYSHQQSKISFEDFISVFEKISDLSTRYGIKYSKKKREKDFIQLKL